MSAMIYTFYGFAIIFFTFWCGKWVIHVLALIYGKYKLHKKPHLFQNDMPYPSVSILKPLMGVDPNLACNLETFFTMNYPKYELLFCIEDKNDPAIMIVKHFMEKYPNVDAQLFLGGSNVGVNPKINNMNPGYLAAKYEYIMISDSGIRMKEDTLLDMAHHMTEKVALVHQLPFTSDREGFAATFEKIFFGTMQSRIYLVSNLLGIICHTGMSSLMRKSVIDQFGGLKTFGCYLAEDFFIAKRIMDAGYKITISSQPAIQNSGICDISSFQARLTRWAKLRVAMVPTLILLEPMAECLVLGALSAWSVSFLFRWDSLVFFLIHILLWFLSDWLLLSIVQNGTLPFNKFEFVVGWLFREISGPYLLFLALWNPEITWRTRIYKLAWGGKAYELDVNKEPLFNSVYDDLKEVSQFGTENIEMNTSDKMIRTNNENHVKYNPRGEFSGIHIISNVADIQDQHNLTHIRDGAMQSSAESNNHHHLHHHRSFSSSSLLDKQQNQQQIIRLHQMQTQQNNIFISSSISIPKIKS
uniref:ceramide glucosyltransferase n=1 Tax=Culicoides sonorensis TaxID=179676 RepID=A0A336LLW1_CULSO